MRVLKRGELLLLTGSLAINLLTLPLDLTMDDLARPLDDDVG